MENSMELQHSLPDHYHVLAEELGPLTAMLREVLQYYPSPDGKPLEDISGLIEEMNRVLEQNIRSLAKATDSLAAEVLVDGHVPRETIRQVVAGIEEPLLNMITSYYDFWERPFPVGMEDGQALFTAILRKPVEEYLGQLERILFIIENPHKTSGRYDISRVDLKTAFDIEDVVNTFHEWLKRPHEQGKSVNRKGLWVLLLALSAGFALAFLSTTRSDKTDKQH